jgi:hypothetical protein
VQIAKKRKWYRPELYGDLSVDRSRKENNYSFILPNYIERSNQSISKGDMRFIITTYHFIINAAG